MSAMIGHEAALHYAQEGSHYEDQKCADHRLPQKLGGPDQAWVRIYFRGR